MTCTRNDPRECFFAFSALWKGRLLELWPTTSYRYFFSSSDFLEKVKSFLNAVGRPIQVQGNESNPNPKKKEVVIRIPSKLKLKRVLSSTMAKVKV